MAEQSSSEPEQQYGPSPWHATGPSQYPRSPYPPNPYQAGPYQPGPYQAGPYQPGPYPYQGGWQVQPYPPNPAMRAASNDRERAVDVLKAAFAEGRLTQAEYDDRMGRAYEARTYGDLIALTSDLPAGALPVPVHPGWHPPVRAAQTNGMAIASMVLGIAEFATFGLTAIPAVICGHIAQRQMRETGEEGGGMAATGLVLGYTAIALGLAMLLFVLTVVARNTPPYGGYHP